MIAFFGGLAGVVAGTRKEKSTVIPGVAIATALMPPLCTAGYGLATGQLYFFLGAAYLFFINSLFICLATFIIVKHLKFHKVEFSTPEREKRVSRYILIIALVTILPSIYLAYRIVQRSIFEGNAKQFISTEFRFPKTQVVTRTYSYDGRQQSIELLLIGESLPESKIDSLRKRLPAYNLSKTRLIVHQGLDAKQKIDLSAIKASVLEEVYAADHVMDSLSAPADTRETGIPDLSAELKALYPNIQYYSLAPVPFTNIDPSRRDTLMLFTGKFSRRLPLAEKRRLTLWIRTRINPDSLKVIVE